ncbi:MAG: GNAT family N-acetyltransferase [Bdellovibrionaceae bacterium]|nr:GNAT family N-acetyltransferase [Pseudobdellovibrionaceae bacterium]
MKITISPFNIDNMSESFQFLLDTFQISFGDDKSKWPNDLGNYSFEKFNEAIIKILKNDPEAIFSVWDGNRLIGQIELKTSWKESNCGYVSLFYLLPEYRKRGVGILMEKYSMSVFKKKGLLKARLTVSELNLSGIKFYEKNGWKHLGPDPECPMGLTMEKEL